MATNFRIARFSGTSIIRKTMYFVMDATKTRIASVNSTSIVILTVY